MRTSNGQEICSMCGYVISNGCGKDINGNIYCSTCYTKTIKQTKKTNRVVKFKTLKIGDKFYVGEGFAREEFIKKTDFMGSPVTQSHHEYGFHPSYPVEVQSQ